MTVSSFQFDGGAALLDLLSAARSTCFSGSWYCSCFDFCCGSGGWRWTRKQARTPKRMRTARIEPAVAAPIVTVWLERLGTLVRGAAATVGSDCRIIEPEDETTGDTAIVVEFVSVAELGESGAGLFGVGTTVDVIEGVGALDAFADAINLLDAVLYTAVHDEIDCVAALDSSIGVVDLVDCVDFVA